MEDKLLTREECEKLLNEIYCVELELSDYEIVPATDAHGFLGEYYRLILYCSEFPTKNDRSAKVDSKLTFFVKSLPLKSIEAEITEIFQKEAYLYARLLKDLQSHSTTQWCPKPYYIRSDLFVLQDLCGLGYEKCHHDGESLSNTELKAILSTLAALHASSLIFEERTGLNIDKHYSSKLLKEITVSPSVPWFTTGLKTVLDLAMLHPAYQSEKMKEFISSELEALLRSVFGMLNPSIKYRNVLCHRDPWYGNVLFNYTNMTAILVDFQTCRYCPPSIDVIFAIFMNQRSEVRSACEKDYLIWYYEKLKWELNRHGIDAEGCLPLGEVLHSYEEFKLFGLLYRAMAVTLIAVPAEFITNDYKNVERTEKLLRYMKLNASFRDYMESCIDELLDYVTKNDKQKKS